MPSFGPVELTLIMVIVVMLFGVGKLPEVFGAVGKGMREFRRQATDGGAETTTPAPAQPVESVMAPEINAQAHEVAAH
jgi:sec-independent protein translocase protein TatA